ncbi:MAG TPA: gamma-glutamylcyclotransferase family protein [Candidatus Acidoferrales bacterium]|nr:gamma-glutamylcyclotransferase family protein [Candidatus Acidoferrales bacterium]
MSHLWYFGYGSNMSRAIFLERRKMQPLEARPGFVDGHRLCFNIPVGPGERGVANLEPEQGARTWGVLYHLTIDDFDRLDQTEGVGFGLYRRAAIDVVTIDDQRIAAFTYQSAMVTEGRKPSPRYIGLLLDGAREHALPDHYIDYLQSFELAVDERDVGGR